MTRPAERDRLFLDVNVLLALGATTHQHHGGYEISVSQALEALVRMRHLDGRRFVPDCSSLAEAQIATDRMLGSKQVTDFHLVNLAAVTC